MLFFVGNEIINLVKDIFFIYVFGLGDFLCVGKIVMSCDVILVLLVLVGVIYLFFMVILIVVFKKIEKFY